MKVCTFKFNILLLLKVFYTIAYQFKGEALGSSLIGVEGFQDGHKRTKKWNTKHAC